MRDLACLGRSRLCRARWAGPSETCASQRQPAADAASIAGGLARVDRRVDGALSKTALVRYDAFQQKGGEQSATIAVLNGERTGLVISAIQGRDYARIYMKELDRGRASVALSPEELEAVERAMAH